MSLDSNNNNNNNNRGKQDSRVDNDSCKPDFEPRPRSRILGN